MGGHSGGGGGGGGGGDLWDDQLLIQAFNNGISKYKKMHNMEKSISFDDAQNEVISFKEDISDPVSNGHDAERDEEIKDDSATATSTNSEIDNNARNSTAKETHRLESQPPENILNSANDQYFQCEQTVHPNSQSPKDYNQLLNEYHELEARRQEILRQLNEYSYGNYPVGYVGGPSEQNLTSAPQDYWNLPSSICPYGCQSWITPCSQQYCYFNKASTSKSLDAPAEAACSKDSEPFNDNDSVKIAKTTVERALSSTNKEIFANEGKDRQQTEEMHAPTDLAEKTSSGTDLITVLNAWYSAGLCTGKYLTEQSLAKK